MPLSRAEVPREVSELLGRPARWADLLRVVGDYEGRERTVEVFHADAREQREFLRVLRPMRAALEEAAGGPIIVLFHARTETTRLYPEMRRTSPT